MSKRTKIILGIIVMIITFKYASDYDQYIQQLERNQITNNK